MPSCWVHSALLSAFGTQLRIYDHIVQLVYSSSLWRWTVPLSTIDKSARRGIEATRSRLVPHFKKDPPSEMIKISEDWVSGQVVTKFKETSIQNLTSEWSSVNLSEPCGFGWKFGLSLRKTSEPVMLAATKYEISVYFSPQNIKACGLKFLSFKVLGDDGQAAVTRDAVVDISSAGDLIKVAQLGEFSLSMYSCPWITITLNLPNNALSKSPSDKIFKAIDDSLEGKDIIDTRFVLLSRRGRNGTIYAPKSVYANSKILKGFSSELDGLLPGAGFSESSIVDLDSEICWESNDPEFSLDSDLEKDVEIKKVPVKKKKHKGSSKYQGELSKRATVVETSSEHQLDDLNPTFATSPEPKPNEPSEAVPHEARKDVSVQTAHPRATRYGRQILIKDVAFRTWKALVVYLYKSDVTFTRKNNWRWGLDKPQHCSAKSMYRLADRFGLLDLKKVAFEEITFQTTTLGIAGDLFSIFTARYPEIQRMQIKFACEHYTDQVQGDIASKIKDALEGRYPHATSVVLDLLKELRPKGWKETMPAGSGRELGFGVFRGSVLPATLRGS